jgi:DNA-binding response OmpR family regulator
MFLPSDTDFHKEMRMDPVARIFVGEDDETIALGLVNALEHESYDVRHYETGEAAIAGSQVRAPDLVLLDIMLPGMDGLEVLRKLKSADPPPQVILLTAKTEELDRVIGLELGADDYVTKPFSLRELKARVKARLRNQGPSKASGGEDDKLNHFSFANVDVDLRRRVLKKESREHRLTTHEAGVLAFLIRHAGDNVSREQLLEEVWGYSPNMATRTVDNQILKLRKKIEDVPSDPRHILTVHGTGYRFEP